MLKFNANHDDNHFDMLRLFAALLVIFSHSYAIADIPNAEPLLARGTNTSLGGLAVYIFFIISGYLITQSLLRSQNLKTYFIKRALRIFPALWAVTILTVFLIGPLLTALPPGEYFTSPDTYLYLKRLALFIRPNDTMPGVFPGESVNGALWTIPYEFIMYVAIAGWQIIQRILFKQQLNAINILLIVIPAFILGHLPWQHYMPDFLADKSDQLHVLGKFVYYYFIGALLNFIPQQHLQKPAAFIIGAILMGLSYILMPLFFPIALAISLPGIVLYLAFMPIQIKNPEHDLSYGIYLWGMLAQQVLIYYFEFHNLLLYNFAAMITAAAIAFFSWKYIEAPALKLKRYLTAKRPSPADQIP